jgi:Zn-dependent peptidase ImmA (M78 family)
MTANTYTQGDSFENKTFEILKTLLNNDDFYVSGKKSKIFRKKAYYSEKRQSEIIFDIAIETYLDNSEQYSLLTLIECKNYGKPIPVNDLEEFDSKIRQVSEHNTKGILITNNSFQSGAHKFALSTGIGLVRVSNNDEFEWIVRRKTEIANLTKEEITSSFENDDQGISVNFISAINGNQFTNLADLLLHLDIIDFFKHKEKFINIPFVTEIRIDEIIARIETYGVYTNKLLDENKLCNFLESKYSVSFEFDFDLENNTLGKIEFDPLAIKITKSLRGDIARWRFTLAHEVGHLILHYKLLKDKLEERSDNDNSLSYKYHTSEMTSKRLEFQANVFASHLLLPINSLFEVVEKYFIEERIHKKQLYWDNQPVNQQLVLTLLNRISQIFLVSIEVARIRLIALGLLIDNRFTSIRDILRELKFK